jgi:RNA polymerase sigma-70 factor (ECF subfamily)
LATLATLPSAGAADHAARRAELATVVARDADLEDALSDACFGAWRHAAQFAAGRGSAVSRLLTIVRSRAIDLMRRRPDASPLDEGKADHVADPAGGPADRLWRGESQQRLHQALAPLSAAEPWVLGFAYFRDLSHGEVAQATGTPRTALARSRCAAPAAR